MSHFSCVGLPDDRSGLVELVRRAIRDGEPIDGRGGVYFRLRMGGPEIWAGVLASGDLTDVNPYFEPATRLRVGRCAYLGDASEQDLGGLVLGWANPTDGDGTDKGDFPFAFDVPDFARLQPPPEAVLSIGLVGFVRSVEVHPPGTEGIAVDDGTEVRLGAESFLPVGLFGLEPGETPRAEARLYGHVLEVAERHNELTGLAYWWARIRTFGGEIELVAHPGSVAGKAAVGSVVGGSCWLTGRILGVEGPA